MDTQAVVLRYDRILLGVIVGLMSLGIVLIYSASIVSAEQNFGDAQFYLKRQSVYAVIALAVLGIAMNIHYMFWQKVAKFALGAGIIALILVLIPGLAASAKGAARWISLGPIRIQPSEIIKLVWIIYLSSFVTQRTDQVTTFKGGWVNPLAIMSV